MSGVRYWDIFGMGGWDDLGVGHCEGKVDGGAVRAKLCSYGVMPQGVEVLHKPYVASCYNM